MHLLYMLILLIIRPKQEDDATKTQGATRCEREGKEFRREQKDNSSIYFRNRQRR